MKRKTMGWAVETRWLDYFGKPRKVEISLCDTKREARTFIRAMRGDERLISIVGPIRLVAAERGE